MSGNYTICVGTIGSGAVAQPRWRRQLAAGAEGAVEREPGLRARPCTRREPRTIFAGADDGIYKSTDGGQSFARLDSPMNGLDVWKIAFDPAEPRHHLRRHAAGGAVPLDRWRHELAASCAADIAEECPNVRIPRVTALTVDPSDPHIVWAGVEVDGVQRSTDGGDTWTRITDGHPRPRHPRRRRSTSTAGKMVLTTTPREIFASDDTRRELARARRRRPVPRCRYCRSLAQKADDPDDAVRRHRRRRGRQRPARSSARRTAAAAGRWLKLPVEPNSPIWAFATHPADPDRIVACSHYGELYRERRRRRLVAEAAARIHRNPRGGVGAQLKFTTEARGAKRLSIHNETLKR